MKITKAIVAVAGSGTRLLPATKAMPKEMLPIVDKPIIQLVVEELAAAGIKDVIFVTRWDKKPLEDHFDFSTALENDLTEKGKTEMRDKVHSVANLANFVYVRQKGPYGNGTPILSAASLVDDEPFVFAFGDDLVKSTTSFTKEMVEEYEKHKCPIVGVQKVPRAEVVKYGIVKLKEGTNEMERIVEKPSEEESPSELAVFGRFVLTGDIIRALKEIPLGKGNELWLTDAIEQYISGGGVCRVKEVTDGEWLTTGDPANYLNAILTYSADCPELQDILIKHKNSTKK